MGPLPPLRPAVGGRGAWGGERPEGLPRGGMGCGAPTEAGGLHGEWAGHGCPQGLKDGREVVTLGSPGCDDDGGQGCH